MNDNITKLIETLAAKLGTTAEYLWGVLIKQASISATSYLIVLVLCSIGVVFYLRWVTGKFKDEDFDWDDNFGMQVVAVAGALGTVVVGILFLKMIPEIITAYTNPEYWALQEILKNL